MYNEYQTIFRENNVEIIDKTVSFYSNKINNPSIIIINNYNILGYKNKKRIIEIILTYIKYINKENNWHRSYKSLLIQLYIFNIIFYFLYTFKSKKCENYKDVILYNEQEELYNKYSILKLIKYIKWTLKYY